MADMDDKIREVYKRIQKEHKMVEGFRAMAAATANIDTKRSCEAKVRDSEKSIQWFEQSLRELEKKRSAYMNAQAQQGQGGVGPDGSSTPSSMSSTSTYLASDYPRSSSVSSASTAMTGASTRKTLPPTPGSQNNGGPQHDQQFDSRYGQQQYGQQYPQQGSFGNFGNNGASTLSIRRKPNYTNLDLIKYDTPLNSAKISKMLNQLEFKLRVEKEYMQGIEKMAKLYQVEGDKKARQDAEAKRIESKGKKDLLETALKRYKTLDIMGGVFDDEEGNDDDAKGLNRKPVSGTLQITIKSARDLDHLPTNRRKPTETVVVVKVEDTPRARTHPSRADRWNEDFELHVDKANEVEVTIYDRVSGASDTPTPIGMLWIRLSDVVDELRRKKVGAEAGAGWVTAAGVEGGGQTPPGSGIPGHQSSGSIGGALDMPVAQTLPPGSQTAALRPGTTSAIDGIDSWFSVEPAGQIDLHLNFIKSNVRKRPYDAAGLGRQGAVRKRKEEIHEQNGHKFVQRQFYGVVLCAFCQEFLLKAAGMQCEDCRFTCHKKCYDKVVTKCVSKTEAEADKDGDKVNHRIPHRFEPITTLSPSWCCHCGQIVPLTRKKARRCTECGLSCHADCAHLVPDFCGMSMEMARQLIGDIRSINKSRSTALQQREQQNRLTGAGPPSRVAGYGASQQVPSSPSRTQVQELTDGTGRMQLQGGRPLPPTQQGQNITQAGPKYSMPGQQGQALQQQQQRPPQQQGRVPVPQDVRDQYPLPAAAAPMQQGNYPLPPGAAGPQTGFPDYGRDGQQQQQQGGSAQGQVPPSAQPRPGGPPQGQRPYSGYGGQQMPTSQQQGAPQMQGPRPISQYDRQQQQGQGMQVDQRQSGGMPTPQQFQQQQQQQVPLQQSPVKLQQQLQQQHQRQSYIQQQQQQQQQQAQAQGQQQQPQHGAPSTPTKPKMPLPPTQQQQQLVQQQQQPQQVTQQQQQLSSRKVGLDDFNFLAVLGKGNFGKVMLAEEKRSNRLWAIKVLKKEFIIENDEIESTKSEKRVFLAAARERHPFLLDLHSCFQTETRIYFVMEYVSGGDLMLHIQREHFTPRRARFYAAEVLLALEYFHKQGIIYRDLKLDNILLTLDGHIKLADYGLCKENMWYENTTSTFCGTPEFMAPEILREQRYGRAVDWWAFGVLIYEMLLGQSPFRGDDEDEIFDAILEDEPLYPIHMPHASVSILQQLLCREPNNRLGAGPNDAEDIKRHVFFKDINWDDIMAKKVPAPYYPSISGPLDTSNFDQEFTKEQPTLTPVHSQLSAQDQKEFREFSWIGPAAMEGYA